MKIYKLMRRNTGANGEGPVFALTVPPEVGKKLHGRYFSCEITDEGVLYRLIPERSEGSEPAWLKESSS